MFPKQSNWIVISHFKHKTLAEKSEMKEILSRNRYNQISYADNRRKAITTSCIIR